MESATITENEARPSLMRRVAMTGAGAAIVGAVGSMGAFAQEINLTPVTDIMTQMPDVITPIGGIVVAIAPILIIVSVVGFATGIFDAILGGISGAFIFKK